MGDRDHTPHQKPGARMYGTGLDLREKSLEPFKHTVTPSNDFEI